MNIVFRYVLLIIFVCVLCIVCVYVNLYTGMLSKFSKNKGTQDYLKMSPLLKLQQNKTQKGEVDVSNMSALGKRLFSSKENVPDILSKKQRKYLILIWKYGPFLERRHIRRFSQRKYSPWEDCSVKSCLLSYESADLNKADAVVFLLHRTRSVQELPRRTNYNQRWIFLSDESPIHTFLYGNQDISDYDGLFNWTMTYKRESDIPVPYGRTVMTKLNNISSTIHLFLQSKKKLVAIMGSNCGGANRRWNYVRQLKQLLGNDLEIYGSCLNGNTTACPGHFGKDCPLLKEYKFYLAFENSNCKEYLTEKVFWNGYKKYAVPIIMGTSKEDCEQLLPPFSFLHVNDFATPAALVKYIKHLHKNEEEYLKYHQWRKKYRVLNEHGYFGTASRHYCRICEALHYNDPQKKVYNSIEYFWSKENDCDFKQWKL